MSDDSPAGHTTVRVHRRVHRLLHELKHDLRASSLEEVVGILLSLERDDPDRLEEHHDDLDLEEVLDALEDRRGLGPLAEETEP